MKVVVSLLLCLLLGGCVAGSCPPCPTPTPPDNLTAYLAQMDTRGAGGITAVTLDISGSSELDGGLTVDDSAFEVADVSGNTLIAGTLGVTGTTTLAGEVALTKVNAANGSANPLDFTGTLGIMNGSDDFTAIDINITDANHTSTGNTVQAIDIAGITADADATEIAVKIGAGWDYGLDLDGNAVVIGADAGVTLDETSDDVVALTMGAGAGTFSVLTGNLKVGNGSPGTAQDGEDAYVEGGLEVDGTGKFDGAVNLTQTNAANGSANPLDYTATAGAMDGSDDLTIVDINLTNADHAGSSNTVQAIDIAAITGDADATETAIAVGTGWDYGLDLNGTPVIIGADAGVTLDETSDDVVALTLGAGSGTLSVLTGNLKVGNGSPGTAQDGEDAYVEGGFEVDGTVKLDGEVDLTLVNAANGSANPIDYTGTLGTMDNSDDFTAVDINITNANHAGSGNTVQAIDIAGITADAEATETAIKVGAGWDYGLDLDGNVVIIGADAGVTLDETGDDVLALTMGAGAGTFSVLVGNIKVGDASPNTTQDGEDAYVEGGLEVDGAVRLDGAVTFNSTAASVLTNVAGGSANPIDYTATAGIMDGSDDLTVIDINLTNADHTGASNTVQAVDVASITGDADATETAIMVGTGWDAGLDVNGTPIVIGADGGATLDETSDDVVALSLGAGAGTISVLTGNLKVGNGSPGTAQDGEDAYVEGGLEVDGTAKLDGEVDLTLVNAASGSANPFDFTGTLGIMDNSDDFTVLDINITNADHTGSGNTIQAVDIAGITGDAEATETAVVIGTGWDYGLDLNGTPVVIGADGGVTLDETSDDVVALTTGAGAGTFSVLTGNLKVGNGSPGTAQDGEDAYVEGNFEVDGTVKHDGEVDLTLVNVAGASANPLDYTGTAGIMDGSDDLTIVDINLTNADHTGASNTVQGIDIAGITADPQATETAVKIGAGWDYGLDLDGNVVVIGADAGVTLDETSDDVVALTMGAGAGTFSVLTGNLKVGAGSPGTAQDGEDAYVTGGFEVDGTAKLDGAVNVGGALAADGGITVDTSNFTVNGTSGAVATASTLSVSGATTLANDATISTHTTGNAGAKNELTGLVRVKMVALGTMTNGTTETTLYVDDDPDGEWTAIDESVTVSADASIYRIGAKSLKLAFAVGAEDNDGATVDITNDDLEANESIGFWIYSDTVLDAGDVDVLIDDTDADTTFDVCAVATINAWQWCEVNVTDLAAGTGNVVDKVGFVLKDAAGLGAFNIYIDGMWKWDADDEEALSTAIITDGVYSVMSIATGEAAANTPAVPVENTDYFVHYETGNDFIVTVTNQSANSGIALIAY